MYDVDAIEAINFDQLVTATDRLLLRGGRVARRRPSVPSLATGPARQLCGPRPLAHGAHPRLGPSSQQPRSEQTAFIRTKRTTRTQASAFALAIPALAALAFALAALL